MTSLVAAPIAPSGRIACPSVEAAAEAILRDAPPRFVAVGFSLGGFVVLELLRAHRSRLAGAVLIASNALPLQGEAEAKRQDLKLFEREGPKAVVARHWATYVAPANAARDELRGTIEAMADDTPLAAFAAQTELAVNRPDSRDVLAATEVPTLLIDGELDTLSPAERNRALRLSDAVRRVEIAGSGHFVPLEAALETALLIKMFVAEAGSCCSV